MRTKRWYTLLKVAADHGDTLHGQRKSIESEALAKSIIKLRAKASSNDLDEVLPRWRGEAKRMIFLLPPAERIGDMSMFEIEQATKKVQDVNEYMSRYSTKRMREILGDQ